MTCSIVYECVSNHAILQLEIKHIAKVSIVEITEAGGMFNVSYSGSGLMRSLWDRAKLITLTEG